MLNLAPEHITLVRSILQQYIPDSTVWMFGSRIHGKAKPFSDVDLAIITGTTVLSPETRLNLQDAFNDAPLPMKVDFVELHTLPLPFSRISGNIILYFLKEHRFRSEETTQPVLLTQSAR